MILHQCSFRVVFNLTCLFFISSRNSKCKIFWSSLTFDIALKQPLLKLGLSCIEISFNPLNITIKPMILFFRLSLKQVFFFFSSSYEPLFYVESSPPAHIKFLLMQFFLLCFGSNVPIMSFPYLFMCDDVTTKRPDGCCVIIERSMKLWPYRAGGVEGCLSEQV